MNPQLQATCESALKGRQLLEHSFYRRWEAGELTLGELRSYAEQYRHFETMLPDFLERLGKELAPGTARELVLDNLSDEAGPPSHLELFELFATFLGAQRAPASPAMKHLVESYYELLEQNPAAALAGLLAYESQGAAIADSKVGGLARQYGATPEATEFWTVHGSVELDHARWTQDALSSLQPDLIEVDSAMRLIGDAWWAFLDEREALAA